MHLNRANFSIESIAKIFFPGRSSILSVDHPLIKYSGLSKKKMKSLKKANERKNAKRHGPMGCAQYR